MKRILNLSMFLIIILVTSCTQNDESFYLNKSAGYVGSDNNFQQNDAVSAPPFSDGIFPCSDCHEGEPTNPEPRELIDMHDDISAIFDHDKENRWCLDCHNMDDRNYLHLANGKLVSFEESYKLCGQCHGDKLRDWKVGVHGKRTGMWNGKKQYYLCVNCHNPHSPHFKQLKPLPPPVNQKDIVYKDKSENKKEE